MPLERFTTVGDHTWTAPSWISEGKFLIVGPGGNGGGSDNVLPGGGGGGAAKVYTNIGYAVTGGSTYNLHLGTPGAETSWIFTDTTLVADYGKNGDAGSGGGGGLESASTGDSKSHGFNGGDAILPNLGGSGGAGNAFAGGYGNGGALGENGQDATESGGQNGGGGGGAGLGVGTTGGAGEAGVCEFYYYPDAPTGLNGTTISSSQINISWDAISSPDDYEYRYDTTDPPSGGAVSTGTTASASVTGLAPSTTYYFQVRARDSYYNNRGGHGPWSASISQTTNAGAVLADDSPFIALTIAHTWTPRAALPIPETVEFVQPLFDDEGAVLFQTTEEW